MALDRKAMLDKIRAKMKARSGGGRQRDPHEFRAPKVQKGQTFKVKAYVLPPLNRGEMCSSGEEAKIGMDDLFYFPVGFHWINNKYHPCPRIFDGDDCPYCSFGFDLMRETDDREARSEISRTYLPRTQYAVNLYFPPFKTTPEEFRGKVMYYALPKTIFDKLEECIQRDDDGGDADDPMPFGLFYDPENAYTLAIEITKKGEYNNYENSKFLPASLGPIAKDDKKIQAILDMRHDIPDKYDDRDPSALRKIVAEIMNTDDSDGFDADETSQVVDDSDEVDEILDDEDEEPVAKKASKSSKSEKSDDESGSDDFMDPELEKMLQDMQGN